MDTFGATLKANAIPFRIGSQCARNQRSVFWGGSIGRSGRCEQIQMNVHLRNNSSSQNRAEKLKPGVAYSVLMSDISEETSVCEFSTWYLKSMWTFTGILTPIFISDFTGSNVWNSKSWSEKGCFNHTGWRCWNSLVSSHQPASQTCGNHL